MSNRIFTTAILLLLSSLVFAQGKIVYDAVGKCEVSRHITLEQAEKKALQEAKQEALRMAGVSENVWSVFGLVTQQDGEAFSEVYSEMSVLAIGGLIKIIKPAIYSTQVIDNKLFAIATIPEAEVKNSEKMDKTYVMDVTGISSVYKENEAMTFDLSIYGSDSYVKIFWFDSEGGSIIYPFIPYDKDILFQKGQKYTFPLNPSVEYAITKKDPNVDTEIINIMVIATKKDYPFLSKTVSFESLLRWIYDIPAPDRCAFYQTVYLK